MTKDFIIFLTILEDIPVGKQVKYWISYFPKQMLNGYIIFMETKKQFPQGIFQRRSPRSDQSKTFKMDELDVDAMINAIKHERYVLAKIRMKG